MSDADTSDPPRQNRELARPARRDGLAKRGLERVGALEASALAFPEEPIGVLHFREHAGLSLAGLDALSPYQVDLFGECVLARGRVPKRLGSRPALAVRPDVADLGPLAALEVDDLAGLKLASTRFGDDQVAPAFGLGGLTALSLAGLLVTERSTARLAAFTRLQALDLSRTLVADDLGQLPSGLTEVRLNDTPVGDEAVPCLARLTALRSLELSRTAVTGRGVASLAALPALEALALDEIWLDGGLWDFGPNTTLRELSLRGCYIDGLDAVAFTRLRGVEVLRLSNGDLESDYLRLLGGLPSLRVLDLAGMTLNDRDFAVLPLFPALRELGLAGCDISGRAVTFLAQMIRLERLDLTDADLAPEALDVLVRALPECAIEGIRYES